MQIKTVAAHTLGCKVNQYDTQAMLELFEKRGYEVVDFSKDADIVIINTCTVTSLADKKSRQLLQQVKNKNPRVLVAAGCYVERIKDEIFKYCDIAIGTADRNNIVNLVEDYLLDKNNQTKIHLPAIKEVYEPLFITRQNEHKRAHMKIQEGCNNRCAYCIIPSVRGNICSRKLSDIETEATSLHSNNIKEVVLTGINLSSYGKDQLSKPTLFDVVCTIEKANIKRIRLGSIDPGTFLFIPQLLSKSDVLCPHFHLSLQSGCDKTLKAMNRWYTTNEYFKEVSFIKTSLPNCAITTDIIVGFPGESQKDFDATYDFIKKVNFARIHVFSFSPRPDTKAFDMKDQVPKSIKHKRVHQLIEFRHTLEIKYATSFIGKELSVLFETYSEGHYIGYSREYIKVKVINKTNILSQIHRVTITNVSDNILLGEII